MPPRYDTPTTATSWNQQQQINRMIDEQIASIEVDIDGLEAAATAAETDLDALVALLAALQTQVDALIAQMGSDCCGTGGGPPPFGDCGTCTAGTTPASYTVDMAGVDLGGAVLAISNVATWEAYFNNNSYELPQIGTCQWYLLDDSVSLEYRAGITFESIKWNLQISGGLPQLEVTGCENDDGSGTNTRLLLAYPATDTAGSSSPAGNCDDFAADGAILYYRNGTSQDWNVPADDEIPDFQLTITPGGSFNCPSQ